MVPQSASRSAVAAAMPVRVPVIASGEGAPPPVWPGPGAGSLTVVTAPPDSGVTAPGAPSGTAAGASSGSARGACVHMRVRACQLAKCQRCSYAMGTHALMELWPDCMCSWLARTTSISRKASRWRVLPRSCTAHMSTAHVISAGAARAPLTGALAAALALSRVPGGGSSPDPSSAAAAACAAAAPAAACAPGGAPASAAACDAWAATSSGGSSAATRQMSSCAAALQACVRSAGRTLRHMHAAGGIRDKSHR